MDKKIRCSVVMAAYNGERYIEEQIDSILKNFNENDELIISDDGSSDKTREIIKNYVGKDKRISFLEGPHKGVISNFENALKQAKGEILFLCDQDDIWSDNKIDKVLSVMDEYVTLVMHDAVVFQADKVLYPSFMAHRGSKPGWIHNIFKNSYIGCCIAFKRELLEFVLPFPKNICMHDQWIGLVSEMCGKNIFIPDKLISYRRHENNASTMSGLSVVRKIQNRINMLIALIRCRNERNN